MSQAARLQSRQRFFNLVVTNIPGPQIPLYLLGRRLRRMYPVVPLAQNQALGIAIFSYDGALGFGLLSDYDALPELEQIATGLERAFARLAAAAGVTRGRRRTGDAAAAAAGPGPNGDRRRRRAGTARTTAPAGPPPPR
jgi:hypothetical protein